MAERRASCPRPKHRCQIANRLVSHHLGAARGELLQQRGEFSLDLDHVVGFGQISLQPRVVPLELGYLLITRIIARPTGWRCQALQRAVIALLAPFADHRRVQPFASQQRPFGTRIAALVFGQDPQFVWRGIRSPSGPLGNLRINRLGHRHSMPAGHHACHHPCQLRLRSRPPARCFQVSIGLTKC